MDRQDHRFGIGNHELFIAAGDNNPRENAQLLKAGDFGHTKPPDPPSIPKERNIMPATTLEIDAEIPDGAPENVVRTVTESSRTLKFASHGFEDS